jgi:predicted GTPase
MPDEEKKPDDVAKDDGKRALDPIAESLARLEDLLERLPGDVAKDLRSKVSTLRTILLEQRPPAFALVGRRGSGKSSLINALFGEKVAEVGHVKSQTGKGTWFDFSHEHGTLAILDTRGVQEGTAPAEGDEAKTPVESILLELRRKAPDAIVFLVKATEVDAAIDGDLDALEAILAELDRAHGYRPPIVGVATHCDLLEPKAVQLHDEKDAKASDIEEKKKHVALVERALDEKLKSRERLRPHVSKVLGVSVYMSWRETRLGTELRADERWRVDDLAAALFKHVPNEGRGMFVRVARVRALQEELAKNLTKAVAAICAGIAAVPIPVADLVPITTLQAMLVAAIAWISGRTLDLKAGSEFLTSIGVNVGAAYVFREAARALIKYVPGAGSAVSGSIAFAGTMAIGAAARAYFIRGESTWRGKRAKRA